MIAGHFFTAANVVSLLRIPLALTACFFLREGNSGLTLLFVVLAILSDALDGKIARMTGTVSDWGKILDPLADKIAFAVFAVTLLLLDLIPLWIIGVLIIRDFLIVIGGLLFYRHKKPPSSNIWGKLATLFLSVYMLRQAVFAGYQLPRGNFILNTDILGLLSVSMVVFSFATYVYTAIKSRGDTDAA